MKGNARPVAECRRYPKKPKPNRKMAIFSGFTIDRKERWMPCAG